MKSTSIKVSSVGIKFFLNTEDESKRGFKGALRDLLSKRKRKEFWALKDINFEIEKGEIFGIIGSNGAGKSTLLKCIAGIYPISEGKIEVNGNIAPLIELGAAFNPELTGAENIYLSGSIYKIPRKIIKENFNKIIDFSGLRKFINSPVKNYSSGMFIRLAFSIVIFFQPDIVLIDEVFSVGDEVFQQKSFEKIISFKERGATLVFVSHDLNFINQICDRVLVLNKGKMAFLGPSEEAVDYYLDLIRKREGLDEDVEPMKEPRSLLDSRRWGNRKVEITSVKFVDEKGNPKNTFYTGDYFEAQISYVSHLEDEIPVFGVAINTIYKMLIYGPNTLECNFSGKFKKKGRVRFIIPSLPLFEGDYLLSASVYDSTLTIPYDHHEMMYYFRVLNRERREFGCVRINSHWEIEGE